MTATASILIMTINYSHDIATAFLAVSGMMMFFLSHVYPASAGQESDLFFIRIYEKIRKSARYSLEWILLAGVPRIIFYMQFEWSTMAGDLQVIAIIIKHIVMFLLVGTGIYSWVRLNRKVQSLKIQYRLA
jgi:hypothetical protein